MTHPTAAVYEALPRRVPSTGPGHRPPALPPPQLLRARLEMQALGLGATFDLAQLAADRWLREVGR